MNDVKGEADGKVVVGSPSEGEGSGGPVDISQVHSAYLKLAECHGKHAVQYIHASTHSISRALQVAAERTRWGDPASVEAFRDLLSAYLTVIGKL